MLTQSDAIATVAVRDLATAKQFYGETLGLPCIDRYGRLLRYVFRGPLNVNLELVREGAATPYFYRHDRGAYAGALERGAAKARGARLGLWGACPRTPFNPNRGADTGPPP